MRIVIREADGRLDKLIKDSIPEDVGLSRSRVKNLIKLGLVKTELENKKIHEKYQVKKNEVLLIEIVHPEVSRILPEKIPLAIVFEDDHIIVINKEPGLVVHPGSAVNSGTLVNGLVNHCAQLANVGSEKRPGIVHRLDKDTSGLLVAAKSNQAFLSLSAQFAKHTAKRQYLAIIWGLPNPLDNNSRNRNILSLETKGIFKISGKIGRHPVNRRKMALRKDKGGKEAVTRFKVLKRFSYKGNIVACLVSCWLETGRTHQIRVHMDAINHGIIGDQLYRSGKKSNSNLEMDLGCKYIGFKRQALHAENLSFIHPVSEEQLIFNAPLPQDFQCLLRVFEELN